MTGESNSPKRRGCFFYGCLTLVVVGLLMLLLAGAAFYVVKSVTARWISQYTDTQPAPIERVEYSREQMDALRARLAAFKEALDKGTEPMELTLTADDLNALIAQQRELRGRVLASIEDGQIRGEVSVPLKDFWLVKLNGRYLNGAAAFDVALQNGVLDVRLREVRVKGRPLPAFFFNEIKKQNLALNFLSDPQIAADIAKFESIQVTNETVVLRSKAQTP